MTRRVLVGLLLLIVLLALGVLYRQFWSNKTPRHVIVISLDTTRRDHLGAYGNNWIRTPHLDRLAAESMVLQNLTVPATTTLPSHVSLFTGMYPHHHGVYENGCFVPEPNRMLPEILAANGYETVGFAAYPLSGRFNFSQGYTRYFEEDGKRYLPPAAPDAPRTAATVTDEVLAYLAQETIPEKNVFVRSLLRSPQSVRTAASVPGHVQ